jgi:anthranilate phosphoribosyltransferase
MKHAAPVRKELGVRTLFNLLGPMTNPAGAPNQVLGVFHRDLVPLLAQVLRELGSRHVLVVHSADGLDELSLAGVTFVAELKDGQISEYAVQPQDYGLHHCASEQMAVADLDEAKTRFMAALNNDDGPERDIVAFNAGAAIYVAGIADSLTDGVNRARAALSSGAAKARLRALIDFSGAAAAA